jgi:hypothetical protein
MRACLKLSLLFPFPAVMPFAGFQWGIWGGKPEENNATVDKEHQR